MNSLIRREAGLELHEIRIGGGIENPDVFLFHIRYQFCLVHTDVRQDERLRLIDLFENAIRKKKAERECKRSFQFQTINTNEKIWMREYTK